jgi:hypothetical protein
MSDPIIKGWRIDPFLREITEVKLPRSDIHKMYKLLSTPYKEVECFDLVRCEMDGKEVSVYVDDEGLFDWQAYQQQFFQLADTGHGKSKIWSQPLAGCGLALGCDDEGNSADVPVTLEVMKDSVQFPTWIDILNYKESR